MANSMSFLGLIRKAGKLEIGEELTGAACHGGKAKLVITALDISDNSMKRAENYAQAASVPLVKLPYTKIEMSECLDKGSPAMAAITEIGLAAAFMKRLAAEQPGEHEELSAEFDAKAARVQKRRKESAGKEKSRKMVKRRKRV